MSLKDLLRKPSPVNRTADTVQIYRSVFGKSAGIQGDMGRQVLTWLIERCGMFQRIENEEQRILHNWGIELLENMGLIQGLNYRALVDAILQFGIPDEAIDREGV